MQDKRTIPIASPDTMQAFVFDAAQALPVPLRVIARKDSQIASLWIVTQSELYRWIEVVGQTLVEQLAVAYWPVSDPPCVLVRPLRKTVPPVLVWTAAEFHVSRVVPQVHLPMGYEFLLPVRPQAIQSALDCGEQTVTWITLDQPKSFAVHSVLQSAFRPLREMVDYEIAQPKTHWQPWSSELAWDFEPFDVLEEVGEKKPKPQRRIIGAGTETLRKDRTPKTKPSERKASRTRASIDSPIKPQFAFDEVTARRQLATLEKKLLASEMPLDSIEHSQDWLDMAGLHFPLHDALEGMLCLSHAVWNGKTVDPDWLKTAWRQALPARWNDDFLDRPGKEPTTSLLMSQWEKVRSISRPTAEELSHWVLGRLWLSAAVETSHINHSLREMQEFLQRFEGELPARVAWLGWQILTRTMMRDVLTLARARDRFLDRLFQRGIRQDRDCPRFLLSPGEAHGNESRIGGGRWTTFRPMLSRWSQTQGQKLKAPGDRTAAYFDLILAFGMARNGEAATAKEWLRSASEVLQRTHDPLHQWSLKAYQERIEEALKGEIPKPCLSGPLLESLEQLPKRDRFKLDRLRQASRILEPGHSQDSFQKYHAGLRDDLADELESLKSVSDPVALAEQFSRIKAHRSSPEIQIRILLAGLELAPRMGTTATERLLNEAWTLFESESSLVPRLRLLEKSLPLAAHFDLADWTTRLLNGIRDLWEQLKHADPEAVLSLEAFLRSGIPSLRRYGLIEEMTALFDQLEHSARQAATMQSLDPGKHFAILSAIAGGRLHFDLASTAWPLLDEARDGLLSDELSELQQTHAAKAYMQSLAFAPSEEAHHRLRDFFDRVQGIHDAFSTSSHFQLLQLSIAETLVLAFDAAASPVDQSLKRRLDAEEFSFRQRIHHDLRIAMETAHDINETVSQ